MDFAKQNIKDKIKELEEQLEERASQIDKLCYDIINNHKKGWT